MAHYSHNVQPLTSIDRVWMQEDSLKNLVLTACTL